jgi:sterol 3beta-glucosyltransferase
VKIAILTYGTRGDLQPYAILGRHLVDRGHDVTLSVNVNLVGMAEQAGLHAVSSPLDSQQFFSDERGRAILAAGKTSAFLREAAKAEQAQRDEFDAALIAASEGADVVIASVLTVSRAASIVEAAGPQQRLLLVYTLPIEPTTQYASPYLTAGRTVPTGIARRGTHQVFEALYWRGARANANHLRKGLGLKPERRSVLTEMRRDSVPTYQLISPAILSEPADWPTHIHNVGAPRVTDKLRQAWGEAVDPDGLEAWLDAGEPPIFFGFGSMPVLDPAATVKMITEVSTRLGLRALIGAGWSNVASDVGDSCFVVSRFDHERVLPRCRAAVHHGGAGTTHTVLRAGLPAVVAYLVADQSLWGKLISRIGCGAALPYRTIDTRRLVDALEPLLAPEVSVRCRKVSAAMDSETPIQQITDAIEAP